MRSIVAIIAMGGAVVGLLTAHDLWGELPGLGAGNRARASDILFTTARTEGNSPPPPPPATGRSSRGGSEGSEDDELQPEASAGGGSIQLTPPPPAPPIRPLEEGGPPEWPQGQFELSSDRVASAYRFISRVYAEPRASAAILGLVRRGTLLSVTGPVHSRTTGCPKGDWFEVEPTGYVCTTGGFSLYDRAKRYGQASDAPAVDRGLPYRYGKLRTQGAPRMFRLPKPDEWQEIEAALARRPERRADLAVKRVDVVEDALRGAYFFALAAEQETKAGEFLHTVRGRILPAAAVELLPPTRMRGEHLVDGQPVAFVIADPATIYAADAETPRGKAQRYARFKPRDRQTRDGKHWLVTAGGGLIAREDVRLVRPIAPPKEVDADERWVHVDLSEQVLVAYEGDEPVFATLVASGIRGHSTPKGLFQVRSKHITATMRGPDPDMGVYEVEEVPWTQYFDGSYALHGAYWHDAFGKVRSHGCVNIPPADARWLFHWASPKLPKTWHGARGLRGTWVLTTR